jgi:hypothetical protein
VLYRIRRFGIKQTSKIAGIVYFLLGILIAPFFIMTSGSAQGQESLPKVGPFALMLIIPVFYGLIGFLMTALVLFVYNRIAEKAGGIELDIVYAIEPSPAAEHGAPSAPSP